MLIQQEMQDSLRLSLNQNSLQVKYTPKTDRCIYDICDIYGKILSTGNFPAGSHGKIKLNNLDPGSFVLFVLDGEFVGSRKFVLQ